ncbi:2-keto-4-pentenoate hydratase/2-oxohepta-3-ene-1,7-dioic acid hydratase [Desulfosporosinus acidiphilus SJ4]|uniref:2-keto-4-pentenoate hydratase/2-oxohepta-3-ene-1,7-dioic acid hydratase n=1 Tax=Desulfosporosinus acidiphilus (strain DSM 22704 / JCM 16185 / SJ4) TaxID=646529 RepID=I4D8D8_DESAJ|nr:fumarylacetoacetate hydrolase family protein [Desulfosporosinus acidiphilus]AFM42062.1 2-keto-4-pentenoate hydratase/2-oxohepta-3-ene-1,7-dioic acid hydratase [Desulfosporosinus acidiphilus SJ4]
MKFVRFMDQSNEIKFGVLEDTNIRLFDRTFLDSKRQLTDQVIKLEEVRLLAPVEPSKVICVGLNYSLHIKEMKSSLNLKDTEPSKPDDPIVFLKPQTSVIGPGDKIIYPQISQRVDFEAELAAVIGKTIKGVTEEEASNAILGYTCANDVTARDLQQKDGQWTRGKSFDTFCPLGPWVVTDIDPSDLDIQLFLNGEVKQSSNTKYFITPVPRLISFISQVMTLNPGDVVLTGTPEGVGPMQPGDEVVVKIPAIGELGNTIIAEN